MTSRVSGGLWLGAACALSVVGCSSSTNLPPPFVFNNPGDVELVCFDNAVDVAEAAVVLPFACCVTGEGCPAGSEPVRHALVTQIARGEVAAVDLDNAKVLDSERRVPGFTFVDVGGLPSALVVPRALPRATDAEPGDAEAPAWTYVAGREVSSVRAIPTCRFRLGKACGPEPLDFEDKAAFRQRTEIALPEAPKDMVLDPSGNALWVSIPSAGLLARIELGTSFDDAFAADADGVLLEPTYFVMRDGVVLTPPEPVREAQTYEAVCGLGSCEADPGDEDPAACHAYSGAFELEQPIAPRATSTGISEPSRMRFMPRDPGDDDDAPPLLIVSDNGQAVLHVFAIEGAQLRERAVLPVGAPLRDFTVTPSVPSLTPDIGALIDDNDFAYAEPPASDKRYVYGIDDRDGSLLLFDLAFEADVPVLTPLDAPLPTRDTIDMRRNFRDRILFQGISARALDVVDTRYRDDSYCGETPQALNADGSPGGLAAEVTDKRGQVQREKDPERKAALQAELDALTLRLTLAAQAGANQLRGVFLVVAAADGSVSVIDVHDLDLQCRARFSCDPVDITRRTDVSDSAAVAVRRHAARLANTDVAQVSVSSPSDLASFDESECPEGFYQPSGQRVVCVVDDPWTARDLSWSVSYQGAITGSDSGVLKPGSEDDLLELAAPDAFDFCLRGVNAGDDLNVAITGIPDRALGCPTPTARNEQLLEVIEAYSDRLVLRPRPPASVDGIDLSPAELLRCYPELLTFEVRLHQQYLVLGSDGAYLHRNQPDPDTQRCVVNEALDERYSSRVDRETGSFADPWIAFRLAERPDTKAAEDVSPVLQLAQQSSFVTTTNVDTSSGRADALPARVRFFPDTGDLLIVDSASQGLRRYTLSPFESDGSRFR